jgi:hypothetical protein
MPGKAIEAHTRRRAEGLSASRRIIKRVRRAAVAALLLLSDASGARAAEFVVLKAVGKGSTPVQTGTVFSSAQVLEVPPQIEVTLLSDSGRIVSLTGPTRRPLSEIPAGNGPFIGLERLGRFLREANERLSKITIVRGTRSGTPPDPWLVDITLSGTKCVFRDAAIRLWRPASARRERFSLGTRVADKRIFFNWPAATESVPWPEEIPISTTDRYVATWGQGLHSRTFTLVVGVNAPGLGQAIAHFAEHDCIDQLQVAIDLAGRDD